MLDNNKSKNRGAHGDSSFKLDGMPSSSENPPASAVGSVKCKDCSDFKIVCNPDMPWNMGFARCLKYNLVVDFASMRTINKLECVEKETSE